MQQRSMPCRRRRCRPWLWLLNWLEHALYAAVYFVLATAELVESKSKAAMKRITLTIMSSVVVNADGSGNGGNSDPTDFAPTGPVPPHVALSCPHLVDHSPQRLAAIAVFITRLYAAGVANVSVYDPAHPISQQAVLDAIRDCRRRVRHEGHQHYHHHRRVFDDADSDSDSDSDSDDVDIDGDDSSSAHKEHCDPLMHGTKVCVTHITPEETDRQFVFLPFSVPHNDVVTDKVHRHDHDRHSKSSSKDTSEHRESNCPTTSPISSSPSSPSSCPSSTAIQLHQQEEKPSLSNCNSSINAPYSKYPSPVNLTLLNPDSGYSALVRATRKLATCDPSSISTSSSVNSSSSSSPSPANLNQQPASQHQPPQQQQQQQQQQQAKFCIDDVRQWLDTNPVNANLPSESDVLLVFPMPNAPPVPILHGFPVWQLRLTQLIFSPLGPDQLPVRALFRMISTAACAPKRFGT